MAVRTNKKKSPSIFSHEFIRQNHGDIVCVAFVILFGGSLIQLTSKYMNPLSRFSYTATDGDNNITYGNGVWDLMVVFTFSLLCTVLTCLTNENISDKFIPRLQLSLKKAFQLRYVITYSVFYLFTTVIFALMWKDAVQDNEAISMKAHLITLMKSHPETFVSLYVKIFYTIALSFCVSMLTNIYFWNVKSKHYTSIIFDNVSAFAVYYLMQYFNCGTLGVYLIATFTIPRLFWSLKYISGEFTSKQSHPINLAFSLLHTVAAVVGLAAAWIFTFFMVKNSTTNGYDVKTIAMSGAYVLFTTMSSIVTLGNLKDSFCVVFKSSKTSGKSKPSTRTTPSKSGSTQNNKLNESRKSSTPKKRTIKTNK